MPSRCHYYYEQMQDWLKEVPGSYQAHSQAFGPLERGQEMWCGCSACTKYVHGSLNAYI